MSNSALQSRPGPATLKDILAEMTEAGDFQAAVLASTDGLVISAISPAYDSETIAATVSMLQRVSNEAQRQLRMGVIDEVVIRDEDRLRLICRHVATETQDLLLVLVAPLQYPYRRVSNRAIRQIKELLS